MIKILLSLLKIPVGQWGIYIQVINYLRKLYNFINTVMAEKGILSKDQEKYLSGWLDDKIKLPALLEPIDGALFNLGVSYLDNEFGDKINANIKPKLTILVDELMLIDAYKNEPEKKEQHVEAALEVAFDLLDIIVDVPYLDAEDEALVFQTISELAIKFIIKKLD